MPIPPRMPMHCRFRATSLLVALAVLACDPSSTRPQLAPTPESLSTEMRAAAPKAIETLARALQADKIPVRRIEARDGWLDSGWYHLSTGAPASARAAGDDVVRVRAWAEPSRNKYVLLYVQTDRRSRFDPSLPDGDLAVALKADHPLATLVKDVLDALGERPGIREAASEPVDPLPARRP